MIQEIQLTNFQSHASTRMEFEPGVNIIVGQSDCGKSSVLRALRLVVQNKPNGEEYRSHWGGDTEVSVTFDNGTVKRGRTNTQNTYQVNKGEILKAFGQDVPSEVAELCNMSDVNIQNQMDSPFLLSESSAEVARHFNKVAKLDTIDSSLSYVNSRTLQHNQQLKDSNKRLKEKQVALEQYDNLEEMEKAILAFEVLENRADALECQMDILSTILEKAEVLQVRKTQVPNNQDAIKPIEEVLALYQEEHTVKKKISNLTDLGRKLKVLQQTKSTYIKLLNSEGDIQKVLKLHEKYTSASRETIQLEKLCNLVTKVKDSLKTQQNEKLTLETEFKNSFPDICPLCNKPQHGKK